VPPPVAQKLATELSNSEIIEKAKPAVVYIQRKGGSGSGMIIEADGYILTNAHVVSGVSTATIKLRDGRSFTGTVVGRDEKIDVALLKVQGNNLPVIMLGDSSETVLKQGDEVFAFGYPFGLEGDVSFKEGTISRRKDFEGISYLETSAEIHPGNSGGPLVNRAAQVVGINTQVFGYVYSGVMLGESIKFALPINLIRGLIPELKAGRGAKPEEALSEPAPQPSPDTSGNRARGFITIYNQYFTTSRTITASTEFIEITSKLIFRIKNTVVVPGGEKHFDYVTPSEIKNIEIIADQSGSEYLLNCSKTTPCMFRMLRLDKGSMEYQHIYGKAYSPFTY
jgi:S1-C subfamily serine protease